LRGEIGHLGQSAEVAKLNSADTDLLEATDAGGGHTQPLGQFLLGEESLGPQRCQAFAID
jgi:hypothetical protein